MRKLIKLDAAEVMKTVITTKAREEFAEHEDKGEMIANLMLAYRHLEDASMRIGKAIQAHEGGVSVYDKDTSRDLKDEVVGA